MERNKENAIKLVKNTVTDLLLNKVDISNLVITKALTKMSSENDDEDDLDKDKENVIFLI